MLRCQDRREKGKEINRHFKEYLLADVNRSLSHSGRKLQKFSRWKILLWALRRRGAVAVLLFRLMRRSYKKEYRFGAFILSMLNQVLCGVEIGYNVDIGPGFEIAHGGGIVIGGDVIAGANLSIRQGVTIGGTFFGKRNAEGRAFPILADNIFIGTGACVAGPVSVGHDVIIGANTVVTRDVPENTVFAGLPGAVIKADGKKISLSEQSGVLGTYLKEIDERLKRIEQQIELFKKQGQIDDKD